MNPEQLSREIADFAFWQHIQNECDRGYVRSGNSVMRRALEELTGKGDTMNTRSYVVTLTIQVEAQGKLDTNKTWCEGLTNVTVRDAGDTECSVVGWNTEHVEELE